MASIDLRCCFCGASFQPGVLNELGKCPKCELEYPGVKTLKEAMSLNQPELHMGNELTVDMVREIIREELGKGLAQSAMAAKVTPDKPALSKHAEAIKEIVKANKDKETK